MTIPIQRQNEHKHEWTIKRVIAELAIHSGNIQLAQTPAFAAGRATDVYLVPLYHCRNRSSRSTCLA